MTTYISILRGINVSGKNKILMTDLKALYEDLGFSKVTTYIQSGNVVFLADTKENEVEMAQQITQAIAKKYSFEVPVLVRTVAEFAATIAKNPFLKEEHLNTQQLHVTFLAELPTVEHLEQLKGIDYAPDRFEIIGKDVFLYCEKYGNTKLSNTFFERKLKVTATTRNWKTVNTLYEMALR